MPVSERAKVTLAFKSGNLCAFYSSSNNCKAILSTQGAKPDSIVGEAAHIYGEKPGSARYKEDMSNEERNAESNLIYLCPTCHTIIDKQENLYPAELLLSLKSKHERSERNRLENAVTNVSFAELEVASRAIATGIHISDDDYHVITPQEKIDKNNLSPYIKGLILSGLSRSSEVSTFLIKQAQLDPKFPDRLKERFKKKYIELKESLSGDELFYGMLAFTNLGTKDVTIQAANLAILCHLFELCEIFEK